MIEIKTKIGTDAGNAQAQLKLPFDLRQKSRLRATLASGEEVGLFLEHGTVLRGGDYLEASDGRIVLRASGTEPLVRVMVEARDADQCAAIAAELVAIVERELPVTQ